MPIQSKEDYKFYLKSDEQAFSCKHWGFKEWIQNDILAYQRLLRKTEYYFNCKRGLFGKFLARLLSWRLHHKAVRLGFSIPRNVFGPGLALAHWGTIAVNAGARIGKNCQVNVDVVIGTCRGKAPVIGDNVYIGPGAKIFGGITIGDNVAIGANSVVNKDVPSNVTVAGVPATIVSHRGSEGLINLGA